VELYKTSQVETKTYTVSGTGNRHLIPTDPVYRQSLWMAGMWHATGLQASGRSPRRL